MTLPLPQAQTPQAITGMMRIVIPIQRFIRGIPRWGRLIGCVPPLPREHLLCAHGRRILLPAMPAPSFARAYPLFPISAQLELPGFFLEIRPAAVGYQ